MNTVAFFSLKGGVGKTASAVNLAHAAAAAGERTLIWDLDAQGAAGFYFRVSAGRKDRLRQILDKKNRLAAHVRGSDFAGLDVIPADFADDHADLLLDKLDKPTGRIRRLLKPVRDRYDFAFLDCPPGTSLLADNIVAASDLLAVPLIPTTLSLRTYTQLRQRLDASGVGVPVVPFFSMVDRRRRLHREIMLGFAEEHPECSRIYIPYATEVEQMGPRRAPVAAFAARSAPAQAYAQLWTHLEQRCSALGRSR